MKLLMNILGIVVVLFVLWLLSYKKKDINYKQILIAILIQFALAFLLIKVPAGAQVLKALSDAVSAVINCGTTGLSFVFGGLADSKTGIFFVTVLGNIVFLSALVAFLNYVGILGFVIKWIGKGVGKLLGTTEVESFVAVANMFLGQTDSPVLISKYLNKMTDSEIMLVLVSGMGSVSVSVIGGYATSGIPMEYLLLGSALVPIGSILVSKIVLPQTEETTPISDLKVDRGTSSSALEAIADGAATGMQIAVSVAASLIAILSIVALINKGLGGIGGLFGYPELTLQVIFSYVFAPFGLLMGMDWNEALKEGAYLGSKLVANEFVAFEELGKVIRSYDARTATMMAVSLFGFANFSSMGICLSGIGVLCPEKRPVLSKLVFRGMLGGFAVSILSAMICGIVMLF